MPKNLDWKWPEILIHHPPDMAEAVADFLFAQGATALVQDREPGRPGFFISQAGFKDEDAAKEVMAVWPDFKVTLGECFLSSAELTMEMQIVDSGDWAEKWKEGFAPIEVGRTLAIKPTWCSYDNVQGRTVVELDPGRAFGTGRHETTFLCLEIIDDLFSGDSHPGRAILDLGTGSGILALACAALGQTRITAVDVDPEVMPVAEENLALNGLSDRVILACGGPRAVRGPFDLILANLTARELSPMAGDIADLARPGGMLVLSGILENQTEEVRNLYVSHGFRFLRRQDQGEWSALILTRG